MIERVRAIIFDLDGTLIDVYEEGIRVFQNFFKERHLPIPTREDVVRVRDLKLMEAIKRFWPSSLPFPPREEIREYFEREMSISLFPGVSAILDKLYQESIFLILISNRSRESILDKLKRVGLDANLFFHIEGVEGTPFEKPNPKAIEKALHRLKEKGIIIPDNVISIGDNLMDFQIAKAWGIKFFALSWGVTSKEKFIESGVPQNNIFDSLVDCINSLYLH